MKRKLVAALAAIAVCTPIAAHALGRFWRWTHKRAAANYPVIARPRTPIAKLYLTEFVGLHLCGE